MQKRCTHMRFRVVQPRPAAVIEQLGWSMRSRNLGMGKCPVNCKYYARRRQCTNCYSTPKFGSCCGSATPHMRRVDSGLRRSGVGEDSWGTSSPSLSLGAVQYDERRGGRKTGQKTSMVCFRDPVWTSKLTPDSIQVALRTCLQPIENHHPQLDFYAMYRRWNDGRHRMHAETQWFSRRHPDFRAFPCPLYHYTALTILLGQTVSAVSSAFIQSKLEPNSSERSEASLRPEPSEPLTGDRRRKFGRMK